VDKTRFKENCERVTSETERRGMGFRAHVKSESLSRLAVDGRAGGENDWWGQSSRPEVLSSSSWKGTWKLE